MPVSLRSLSDHDILSRTRALTIQERELTLLVLLYLNEIERRKLHLKQGYRSMFDYCTSGLGYSASAASRRIRTARCVARFSEVYALLESNEVNLSTVSQVSRVLTTENRADVLRRICGKSQREVEAIVAEYEPRAALPPDRVRTVVVSAPVVATPSAAPLSVSYSGDNHNRSGCVSDTRTGRVACPGGDGAARLERRAVIQFSASEAFMGKLEKVRSLAWHRLPANASFEQVFELALDLFIEKGDPSKRHERREKQERAAPRPTGSQRARHISAPIRDQVFVRDKGQCTYTGANGRRCASTSALQIDHVTPVARGGLGTPANLRLLCAYHNRLEAERLMGRRGARDGPPVR